MKKLSYNIRGGKLLIIPLVYAVSPPPPVPDIWNTDGGICFLFLFFVLKRDETAAVSGRRVPGHINVDVVIRPVV